MVEIKDIPEKTTLADTDSIPLNDSQDSDKTKRITGDTLAEQVANKLTSDDISEGSSNEYYSEAKVSANSSVSLNTAKVSFPEAPEDGSQYARKDAGWVLVTGGSGTDAESIQGFDVTTTNPTDGKILVYRTASGEYVMEDKPVSSGNPAWGEVTGTLANQTDLQNALDLKVDDTQVLTDVPLGAVFTDTVYDDTTIQAEVDLNTTHRTSDGTDHSFINQDVKNTASPSFNKTSLTPQSSPSHSEGLVFYDSDKKALSYYNEESDITVNIGQETIIRVYNNSGSTIPNGSVVYPTGATGGLPTIDLANANFKPKSRIVGVSTHSIENNSIGYVTKFGDVGSLNTSSYTEGDILYLSMTDGEFTTTEPTLGAYNVIVGVVKSVDTSNGVIVVDTRSSDNTVEVTDTNGFPSEQRTGTTLSFNDGTRTFTISPDSSDFYYYQEGKKYEKTSAQNVAITDETGLHAIYFDGETLMSLANPSSGDIDTVIRTKVIVAYVYWNATDSLNYYIGDERHGISMSSTTHAYLHFTRGAQYLNGLALDDFNTGTGAADADAQFSVALGMTADEDLVTMSTGTASTVGLPIFYKTGSSGEWKKVTQSGFSVYNTGSTSGRIFFNEFNGSTWGLTEVSSNNDFVLTHVFATNDINNPIIAVMGENQYATISQARTGANTEMSDITTGGFPAEEFVPIASVIFKTNSGYSNSIKAYTELTDTGSDYVDWRSTELSPSAGVASHSNLSGLTNDDHIQYTLVDGTRAFTGTVSGIAPTSDLHLATKKYVDDNAGGSGSEILIQKTAGEAIVQGDICYLKSDGKYWKQDASAEATCSTELLMANASMSADATGEFGKYMDLTTTGLTAGAIYYASETAGAYTATAPTTSGAIIRIVGTAQSTTILTFNPDVSFAELK